MNAGDIINAIGEGEYDVRYYRPCCHVICICFDDDEYSAVRYVVNSDNETDYGCFEVAFYNFPSIIFDWYNGTWKSADENMEKLLEDETVKAALAVKFSDIAINIGPEGKWDDMKMWKKIISRCLSGDDSLISALDVTTDTDNAQSSRPAKFKPSRYNEWNNVPFYNDNGMG